MKEVQKSVKNDAALDELYKRYQNRGMNYSASPEYAKQESKEVLTRTIAPSSYRVTGGAGEDIERYKSGEHNGQKYMTDGDFVEYYNKYRDYTPGPNVQFDSTVVLQKIDRDRYEKGRKEGVGSPDAARKEIKRRLEKEAEKKSVKLGRTVTVREGGVEKKITKTQDGYLIREKSKGVVGYTEQKPKPSAREKIKKASDEWVPIEERKKEKCLEGKKTRIPTSLIIAIVCITLSLMLIVGSSVILAGAKSEQSTLVGEIESLSENRRLLSEKLEEKNREAEIESFAKDQLGMIDQDYVSVKYIKSDIQDGLKVNSDGSADLWSSIIDAILPFLR